MLFLTLCLHGNQHICWERCALPCVCTGDAAVHPASSGGSTRTLRTPAAVCARVSYEVRFASDRAYAATVMRWIFSKKMTWRDSTEHGSEDCYIII